MLVRTSASSALALMVIIGMSACSKPPEPANSANSSATAKPAPDPLGETEPADGGPGAPAATASTGSTLTATGDVEGSEGKLPPFADLQRIARRAQSSVVSTYKAEGVSGVMQQIRSCYQDLARNGLAEERAYCLLLDFTAVQLEKSMPEDVQAVDLQMDDYLSPRNAAIRLFTNVPPLKRGGSSAAEKSSNVHLLRQAYEAN